MLPLDNTDKVRKLTKRLLTIGSDDKDLGHDELWLCRVRY